MTMERDFTEETSDSDEEQEPEDAELSALNELMMINARNRSLIEKLEREEEKLRNFRKSTAYFERLSRLSTSPLGRLVSPIESPTHVSQNLSKDSFENSLDSGVSSECLKQTFCEPDKALEEQSKNVPSDLQNFENSTQFESLKNSPKISLDNEIQPPGSHTELDNPSDLGITETNDESVPYYVGKGKEAANPAFRYKKGSKAVSSSDSPGKADNPIYSDEKLPKANVLSSETLAKDSSIKSFDRTFRSPASKTHDSQSPKPGQSRISPAIKRKGSYSNEKDFDESSVRTPETSKSYGNRTDDDINIAKKLKFEDDEKLSSQYPSLMELLSKKKHKSIDLAQFMDQPSYEREQMIVPSTSSVSNIVGSTSSSEESSLGSGSEDVYERCGSPLPSRSEDIMLSERDESSVTTISENTSLSGNDES